MTEQQAFYNGRWVPESQLAVSIFDAGFVLGATVTEQLRTFGGQIFRLEDHLGRLYRSLEIVSIEPGIGSGQLADVARRLVAHNYALLPEGDDLALGIFVTPGPYPAMAGATASGPTVCAYTYPLRFGQWAAKYEQGETVVVSDVEQVSPRTWPPELKCRSRMHYFLADRRAQAASPGARAILLDERGYVSEASTANVVLYEPGRGLVSPPRERILPGISLNVLAELAGARDVPLHHRDVSTNELCRAAEVFLTSTSICLLPVVGCSERAIGDGKPGPIYRQLLRDWSDLVGVDIAAQASRFAERR
jgi:branched-subunit amino acid aminotransferase/4-amino-4-deoxychorismate lyase